MTRHGRGRSGSARFGIALGIGLALAALHPAAAHAGGHPRARARAHAKHEHGKRAHGKHEDRRLAQLRERIDAQSRLLAEQARRIEDQERRLREQEASLRRAQLHLEGSQPGAPEAASRAASDASLVSAWPDGEGPGLALRSARGSEAASLAASEPALEAGLMRRGGVLTAKGLVVVEPHLDWTTSSVNRFAFEGLEVADSAVLLGQIEANRSERGALVSGVGVRVGVRDRLELEAQLPLVRRSDRFTSQIVSEDQPSIVTRSRDGTGIGDLELGAHYQLNDAAGDAPIHIANLRVVLPTGKGPFDVGRDRLGFERELPTGAGNVSIEPSLSMIVPSDPTVLFGNVSYQLNLPVDADLDLDTGNGVSHVGRVDPGDAIGVNFGMAVALNDRTSLRLGYDHQYLLPTRTRIDGGRFDSEPFHIGILELGVSHRTRRGLDLILSFGIGVTESAPDVRVSLRMPTSFEMF